MDKNQPIKKKLSLFSKIDHHLSYRLSPTKSSQSPITNPIQPENTVNLLNDKPKTDQDALGERCFKDFTNLFEKDGNIIEFDIIKADSNLLNKSPVILIDHNIAIESWCMKPLFTYLYNQLLNHNKKEILLNDEDLKQKTRLILLLNPSLIFVWNLRKTLVEDGLLSVDDDLNLTKLILKRKPKCPESFIHREWLLNQLSKNNNLTNNYLDQELEICLKAADQYASNYYAWNHRFNLVNKFFNDNLKFLFNENELIKKWINNHISDYSGYHYKQMIISILSKLLIDSNQKDKLIELLNNENSNLKKLLQIYPEQEALYCHKRCLLKLKYLNLDPDENEIKEIIKDEQEFVRQKLKLAKKCDYNWLRVLVNRYTKWIEYNCKIQIDVK